MNINKIELLEFLEELVSDEKEQLEECRQNGDMNSCGSGMSIGSLETIQKIIDWINGDG